LLIRLPYSPPEQNRRKYSGDIQLSENGSFTAEVKIIDYANLAITTRHAWENLSTTEQIRLIKKGVSNSIPNFELSDYKTGQEDGTAWLSFKLEGQDYLNHTETYLLLKPDIFRVASLPFIHRGINIYRLGL